MTPATGWNEHDYYRASRAARRAWQKTNRQLEIAGLEERDAAPVGRQMGDLPCGPSRSSSPVHLPLDGRDIVAAVPAPGSITTTGPDSLSPEDDCQAQRRTL